MLVVDAFCFKRGSIRYREALEINLRRDDVEAQVVNRSNLGSLATASGRYSDAIRLHGAAVELARRHFELEGLEPEAVQVENGLNLSFPDL